MSDVVHQHRARLAALDPLFPTITPPDDAGRIEVPGAVGFFTTEDSSPEVALWAAARRHVLRVRLSTGTTGELGPLLDEWDKHLTEVCTPGDRDEAAVINWPSRDSIAVRELVFHGFSPASVVAVRPIGRPIPSLATPHEVRPAVVADIPALVELSVALHSHDARYGLVTERANAREVLAEEMREAVAEGIVLVAERDGEVIGFVEAEAGERASWAQAMVLAEPTAYLSRLYVRPDARSNGVACALAAEVHARLNDLGAPVTLMEHILANEFSTPFWYRQGYRPLWTIWQRRPAVR
ncbi:GNAT family N-acetyltransferase [Allokutzneria albata]|uniref:N-acetylglutamate synthase, GNAT family n=1 Tax=Allokutzneria albata TaxID=211114 RepID=A0A1H0B0D5_ALLAB|nr:GNAT family N-acetyltransferase [Allokutzneria albata]SDN39088.1 N-acetylglutamate synthase, GNAT family [Allokutzneria albata]